MNVIEAHEDSKEETNMNNPRKEGESLMLKRVLVKSSKQVHELAQRKSLFRTMCNSQGNCCEVVLGSGSTDNFFSTKMVEKLGLKRMKHLTPYKVPWCRKDISFG